MKTKDIREEIFFNASCSDVFEILIDEQKHSELTGGSVSLPREVGAYFTIFDDYIKGRNIEIIEGKKIVQHWNFNEDGWEPDYYTECTFEFVPKDNGTLLIFTQKGVPEHKHEEISKGWFEYYWHPMKELLENRG